MKTGLFKKKVKQVKLQKSPIELLVRAVRGRRRCRWVNNSGSKELGGLPKIINIQDPRVQCIFLFTCTLLPPTVHSWVLTDVDKFGKGKDQRKATWKEGQREQAWCGMCVCSSTQETETGEWLETEYWVLANIARPHGERERKKRKLHGCWEQVDVWSEDSSQ